MKNMFLVHAAWKETLRGERKAKFKFLKTL